MSRVTNVILTWPLQDDAERTLYEIADPMLVLVKDCCAGGSKHLEHNIATGAINYLNLEKFIQTLRFVKWESREDVRLFICEQDDQAFRSVDLDLR